MDSAKIISTIAIVLIALVTVKDYMDRQKMYKKLQQKKPCTCGDEPTTDTSGGNTTDGAKGTDDGTPASVQSRRMPM